MSSKGVGLRCRVLLASRAAGTRSCLGIAVGDFEGIFTGRHVAEILGLSQSQV